MLTTLQNFWSKWLRFAEIFGNIQMTILLTLVYWTILAVIAIPFRLLSNPLSIKASKPFSWTKREPNTDVLSSMKRQG